MSVGEYRHTVNVQTAGTPVSDGEGGYTNNPTPLDPPTWKVSIEPATARDLERIAQGTVLSTASHIVTGRFHPGVTTATQIVFGARTFSVTGVSNPEERNIQTICVCVELVA